MKLILATCFCLLFAASLSVPVESSDKESEKEWVSFKEKFARKYADIKEEALRKSIFIDNLKNIKIHNFMQALGLSSFSMGVNKYSDLTTNEIAMRMNGFKHVPERRRIGKLFTSSLGAPALPKEVDWRKEGYVTPVKDQGQCGSCWAFSSVGAMEGQQFRKSRKLVELSEQNLLDCSVSYGNFACFGGLMDQAFAYVADNEGINVEDVYPYEMKKGPCRFKAEHVGATVSGHVYIEANSEQALMEAVATEGPISVAIDASQPSFRSYKTGVHDNPACSSTKLNHGVLLVGYGTENGKDYWLVKNSWGTSWGEQGYIKMARNKSNQCGIAADAVYPVV